MPNVLAWRKRTAPALLALFALVSAAQADAQSPPPASTANETQLRQAVQDARQRHGDSSEQAAVAWRDLADYYYSEQRLDETAQALEQALVIAESISPNGFGVTRLMQNLAAVYTTNHRPDRAVPLLERALKQREALLGTEHTDLAVILLNLGDARRMLGDYAAALPPMHRALAIREKGLGPDHADIAWATSYIGRVHREIGDYSGALPYFERTLAVREKALGGTHRFVSRSLTDLALLNRDLGNFEAARPLLERALQIDRVNLGPNHPDLVNALSSLGLLLCDQGEYATALPLFERALQIDIAASGPDHPRVAARLTELGLVYRALGDLPRATRLYARALAIEESQPLAQRVNLGIRLHNLGVAYARAGDEARAMPLLKRAMQADEALYGPDHPRVASTVASLALLYRDVGELELATAQIGRAVTIDEKVGGSRHPRLATALLNAGQIRHAAADNDGAAQALVRALAIAARGDQPDTLWRVQHGLADVAQARNDVALSIYWRKQAVNAIQSLRGRLIGLSPELQDAFLTDKRGVYTKLADQLVTAGRLAEAQEVLAMLKQEELYDFIARSRADDGRDTRTSFVGPAETAAQRRWQEIADQLARLGRESADLARKSRLGLSAQEQARRAQVEADLVLANRSFDRFIADLGREFATAAARRAEEFGSRQLRNLVVMQDVLAELGRDAVLLHYVMTERRIAIILTTADVQIARESVISAADLNRTVLAFRQALADRRDVKPLAQALHRVLIAPISADLKQAGARTLMLSLDGTLRYLPFAALHDGRRWLVEDYGLSIYTEAARTQLMRRPQREGSMTGLGLTRAVPGFAPLPAVRDELEGIRRSGLRGEVFLDDQFTVDRLRDALSTRSQVLHIASHFQFRPGTFANSFLVLGDGQRLTLQEVRDRRLRFSTVDLLTLSACDTAMGGGTDENGAEVEGFGALAQQQGAQSVLATLWPVADGSTGRFMQIVYSRRQADQGSTMAAALRDAQIAFLRGTLPAKGPRDGRLAHPFYWAPYVLMGNWL
jgi:CHAT domain-containing protein/Tfp pilus assembly protein PilF